jgi:hypothetical protein
VATRTGFLHPVNIDTPRRKSQLQKYGRGQRGFSDGTAPHPLFPRPNLADGSPSGTQNFKELFILTK